MRRLRTLAQDRGAALIETALVLGLLLMIAIGAFEYGMAFREWLSVTNATREGARLAAQAGDFVNPSNPDDENATASSWKRRPVPCARWTRARSSE